MSSRVPLTSRHLSFGSQVYQNKFPQFWITQKCKKLQVDKSLQLQLMKEAQGPILKTSELHFLSPRSTHTQKESLKEVANTPSDQLKGGNKQEFFHDLMGNFSLSVSTSHPPTQSVIPTTTQPSLVPYFASQPQKIRDVNKLKFKKAQIQADNNENVENIRAFYQDQKYNKKVSNLPIRDRISKLIYSKEPMLESPKEEQAHDAKAILFNGEMIKHKDPRFEESVHFKFKQNIEEQFLE